MRITHTISRAASRPRVEITPAPFGAGRWPNAAGSAYLHGASAAGHRSLPNLGTGSAFAAVLTPATTTLSAAAVRSMATVAVRDDSPIVTKQARPPREVLR